MKGVVNFAGGFKYETMSGSPCNWHGTLVEAFEAYGKDAKVPSIWFYGDNDSYWGSELPKAMHAAYGKSRGKAELVSYGTFPYGDAHAMISGDKSLSIWLEPTKKFMESVGLPTQVKFAIDSFPRPQKTEFAGLDRRCHSLPSRREQKRVRKIPGLSETERICHFEGWLLRVGERRTRSPGGGDCQLSTACQVAVRAVRRRR
jgi:dienelactone hydrolase